MGADNRRATSEGQPSERRDTSRSVTKNVPSCMASFLHEHFLMSSPSKEKNST